MKSQLMNSFSRYQQIQLLKVKADDTVVLTQQKAPYSLYAATFIGLPLIAQLFPALLHHITDVSLDPTQRSVWILSFLLSKRVYLYSTAVLAVLMSVYMRDSLEMFQLSLGQRYKKLNEQLFGVDFFTANTNDNGNSTLASDMESLYQQLDGVQDTKQAVFLPLILLGTLGIGYLLLSLNPFQIPKEVLSYSSKLSSFPTIIVSIMFSKLQINNILNFLRSDNQTSDDDESGNTRNSVLSTLLAVALVGTSFLFPGVTWPLRNIINIFIAMTASELFQLQQFPAILLALLGLTMYDVFGVYGSQSFTDNGQSIMEAVARANIALTNGASATTSAAGTVTSSIVNGGGKLVEEAMKSFQFWSPGLFQVDINNRISDVLGLGDVIFPSILVRWTKYFDEKATRAQEEATDAGEGVLENQRYNMYQAAIGGYIIGLVMCEIFQTGSGAPALLFLVPSMFISLGIQILRSKIPISELIKQQQ